MKSGIDNIKRYWPGRIVVFFLFLLIGAAVYGNSLNNSFQYDDQMYVEYNKNVRTLKNIPYFFIKPRMIAATPQQAGHYRPLVATSYTINYAIGGLNTSGYHLVNLAFHVGSAFLIFLIVQAMLISGQQSAVSSQRSAVSGQQSAVSGKQINLLTPHPSLLTAHYFSALAAGLIFLVHPFNSEAVNYVTARSSVMSGFFYLLGFYCWVRFRQLAVSSEHSAGMTSLSAHRLLLTAHYFYIASILAFVAGMLSKEVLITLPIVLWLYDLYFHRLTPAPAPYSKDRPSVLSLRQHQRSAPRTILSWRAYLPYIPFLLMVVIPYLVIRIAKFGKVLPHFKRDLGTQIFTELPVLVKHWRMFLVPTDLTPFHYVEIQKGLWAPAVLYSSVLLLIYILAALLLARSLSNRWKVLSFFMFWFLIVLIPTTVIPLNAIFQENRGYLAIITFVVFAGVILGEIRKRWGFRWGAAILLILVIVILSGITVQRNRVWKDELSLWSDAVKKAPLSPEVHTALGVAYRRAGMYNQSIEASRKALLLGGPNNFFVHDNLARIYIEEERWELAAGELEMAIRGFPYMADSHNELGVVYYKMGRVDLAEKEFLEAVRLDREFYRPYFNLGVLYTKEGRLKDAVEAYRKALVLNPGHVRSFLHLGILFEELGRKGEAVEYYKAVIARSGEGEKMLAEEAQRRLVKMGQ